MNVKLFNFYDPHTSNVMFLMVTDAFSSFCENTIYFVVRNIWIIPKALSSNLSESKPRLKVKERLSGDRLIKDQTSITCNIILFSYIYLLHRGFGLYEQALQQQKRMQHSKDGCINMIF